MYDAIYSHSSFLTSSCTVSVVSKGIVKFNSSLIAINMTTLVEIPSVKVLHIPSPGSEPLPLSDGTLSLSLIPANPPTHPSQTVAITVGSSSFPVLPNTPVSKVASQGEHPSYVFNPAPADGGSGIGRVKITFKSRFVVYCPKFHYSILSPAYFNG
jgi:hypothetical protein